MDAKPLLFIAWEPPLACLAWAILITDSREVNEKGACLKISFISVLKTELWHLCKSLLPSAKGVSIYFYVVSVVFLLIPTYSLVGKHHVMERSRHIWPFKYI